MIDPTQQAAAAPGAGAAPTQGATVCIADQGDGVFMVYPEGQQAQAQQAQDIDGALELAKSLLGGGQDPAASDAEQDELFNQAFNTSSGRTPVQG